MSTTNETETLEGAAACSDYRKEYGVNPDDMRSAWKAFAAGWDAARGNLDAGGPLR